MLLCHWLQPFAKPMCLSHSMVCRHVSLDNALCSSSQIICKSVRFKEFDLYTVRFLGTLYSAPYQPFFLQVKVEDLTFTSEVKLRASRDDYVHALLCFFSCEFSKTKGRIRFSTGPADEQTHWKQTIFYLKVEI